MNLTLLLDLDDTLLDTNLDTFIPAYFQAFSDFFKDHIEPKFILPALMSGTRKMMTNNDPTRSLQQVFNADFLPQVGLVREEFQPLIDCFYDEVFPTLNILTTPRPEAVELVEWALAQGVRLAVATNPIFPLTAINHRLRWAGLPPEAVPFSVVSSYESFHFTKPNPGYFAEVLGRMGWPDGPVLVVGDDTENDLLGASSLGLSTFWIALGDATVPDGIQIAGRGSIGDLSSWLENTDLSSLEPDCSAPEALNALMLTAPATISGILPSLSSESEKWEQGQGPDLMRRSAPNEWSLTEVLCHLRDTELEINQPRLRMLLELDEPFIPVRNTDAWAEERGYLRQDPRSAFRDFVTARLKTVDLLRGLTNEWQRTARHGIFGPTNLQELVRFMVEHDKLHIRQIFSTIEQLEK